MQVGPYKIRGNPKGKAAWKDSSSVVLTIAVAALGGWTILPETGQRELLLSLGVSPLRLASVSFALTVVAGLVAKHTSIHRVEKPSEPGPDEQG